MILFIKRLKYRTFSYFFRTTYGALLLLLAISGGCNLTDQDKHNKKDQKSLGDYLLYIGNGDKDEVYVAETGTNEIIQILTGFGDVWSLALSMDGKTLYVGSADDQNRGRKGKIYRVDTRDWEKEVIFDEPAYIFISPQGHKFILTFHRSQTTQSLYMIEKGLREPIFIDSLDVGSMHRFHQQIVFDPQEPVFYSINREDFLYAYNYEQKEILRTYISLRNPINILLSEDGGRLFVAGGPVVDLRADSVMGWLGGNRLGSLALHPSKEELYITDPGGYLNPEKLPSGKVYIYDTQALEYIGEIPLPETEGGLKETTDMMVVSPDGRYGYVSNWQTRVYVIDLDNQKIIDVIEPKERGIQTIPLAIGPTPNKQP